MHGREDLGPGPQPAFAADEKRASWHDAHDYKRHGTTTLFAALNVLTGTVIGRCLPRHRNTEFLKFLRIIDREVPKRTTDSHDL